MLNLFVLRILSSKPMFGTEIMKQIATETEDRWHPRSSLIYPCLTWLEEKGYVEPQKSSTRKSGTRTPYGITKKGEEALKAYEKVRDAYDKAQDEYKLVRNEWYG